MRKAGSSRVPSCGDLESQRHRSCLCVTPRSLSDLPGATRVSTTVSLRREAADQPPPGPSTAPPANRAPGCDSEADTTPSLTGTASPRANAAGHRLLGKGSAYGTPGSPTGQPSKSAPQTRVLGGQGRAGLRLAVDWQTELVAGAATRGSTHARNQAKPTVAAQPRRTRREGSQDVALHSQAGRTGAWHRLVTRRPASRRHPVSPKSRLHVPCCSLNHRSQLVLQGACKPQMSPGAAPRPAPHLAPPSPLPPKGLGCSPCLPGSLRLQLTLSYEHSAPHHHCGASPPFRGGLSLPPAHRQLMPRLPVLLAEALPGPSAEPGPLPLACSPFCGHSLTPPTVPSVLLAEPFQSGQSPPRHDERLKHTGSPF